MKTSRQKLTLKAFITSLVLLFALFNTANSQAYKIRMVFVGNSITQGVYDYGLWNTDTSYVAKFGKLMEAVYGDTLSILNAGVSGRCMLKDGPSPIWNESVFATALKTVPDICFILLGTNDSKPSLLGKVKDHFYQDYMAMIDTFKYRNPDTKFIVCDPTPIWDGHPYSVGDAHNDTILVKYTNPLIDSVAKETGAYLFDLHTPFVDSLKYFNDKLHPNPAGHEKIARIIFDTIQKLDLLHSIVAGKAVITDFYQSPSPTANGDSCGLVWTTLYADSVFLDDKYMGEATSTKILATEGEKHTLKAKNSKGSSELDLTVKTYTPVASSFFLETSTSDYVQGVPFTITTSYKDQYNRAMVEKPTGITWTVTTGEGTFSDQNANTVVFTPTSNSKTVIQAEVGTFTKSKTIYPSASSLPLVMNTDKVNIFPNPVTEILVVQVKEENAADVHMIIYNMKGETVLEKDLATSANGDDFNINVADLKNGTYVIGFYIDGETNYGKFVKK